MAMLFLWGPGPANWASAADSVSSLKKDLRPALQGRDVNGALSAVDKLAATGDAKAMDVVCDYAFAADLPDVLVEAHYPDAWWETFKGGWITVKPPRRSPYRAQLEAFCESIREAKPAPITGVDGLRAQEFVQGAYLSMQSGTWVDLPLPEDAPFVVPEYR